MKTRLPSNYHLAFNVQREISCGEHPAVVDIKGTVLCHEHDEGDYRKPKAIGAVSLMLLRASYSRNEGLDLIDQCDAHSQEALDYCTAVYDVRTQDWRRAVVNRMGDIDGEDTLVLDLVKLAPAHRGIGVGLAAAYEAIELFGSGCGVVVCKPFPLQFDTAHRDDPAKLEELGADQLRGDLQTATRKLATHWGRLGFQQLPRSPYMALNLSYKRPSRKDLGIE